MIRFVHLIRGNGWSSAPRKQIRQLKTALQWKIPAAQRERIQMVLLRESGMTQPEIAEAMGISLSTVNRAHLIELVGPGMDDGTLVTLKVLIDSSATRQIARSLSSPPQKALVSP